MECHGGNILEGDYMTDHVNNHVTKLIPDTYTSRWWNNTIWTSVSMVEKYRTPADSGKIPFG